MDGVLWVVLAAVAAGAAWFAWSRGREGARDHIAPFSGGGGLRVDFRLDPWGGSDGIALDSGLRRIAILGADAVRGAFDVDEYEASEILGVEILPLPADDRVGLDAPGSATPDAPDSAASAERTDPPGATCAVVIDLDDGSRPQARISFRREEDARTLVRRLREIAPQLPGENG